MSLSEETCSACRPDATPVSEEEIRSLRGEVAEWKLVEEDSIQKLQRQFSFDNFVDAMAFSNRVGELAEKVGHHPALLTEWGRVTVTWWTHKIGGLHRNDFICAAHTDALYD